MWNYTEDDFEEQYWSRIDKVCEQKVLLPLDGGDLEQHLPEADCILVKLGMVFLLDIVGVMQVILTKKT